MKSVVFNYSKSSLTVNYVPSAQFTWNKVYVLIHWQHQNSKLCVVYTENRNKIQISLQRHVPIEYNTGLIIGKLISHSNLSHKRLATSHHLSFFERVLLDDNVDSLTILHSFFDHPVRN